MPFIIIRTLASLWLAHFLVDFMIGIWAIYKTMAHLDLFLAGLISGVGAFLGEGMQIFFGPMSDRGWRKQLICIGLIVTTASAWMAYTTNYWMLLIFFIATCLGSGAFHPSAVSLAGALTPHRKALMITIFASGGSIGLALSQLVFSHFYVFSNGHTGILIIPTLLLATVMLFYSLKGIQKFSPTHSAHEVNLKALFGLFKKRNLRLLYIAQVCNQTLFWATIFLLPDTLICKGYDSWICHGGGHLFLILGGAVMMIPSGYLADKYSPRFVLLVITLGAMVAFYTFLLFPILDTSHFILLIFILGAFLATVNPVIIAFGNLLAPESPGMVSAFLMGMAWCVSEGLGQSGGGLITRFFDNHAPVYALGILGIFFIVGIIATFLLPQTKKEKTDIPIVS
ncbi:MAG: hypothetical protein BGO14_09655 [Chlamydiales bacterium 38-26]|nr:MFS transporter [Chlamydiales bacterium]OJV11236.1 MAG: hypothetical protein BGO14_09655 [Chlamydiales bacterium 38-26]